MKRLSILLSLATMTLVAISGCGESGPETIRVYGTITFDGAAPPAEGMLTFTADKTEPDQSLHPGSATFDKEGKFEVTSINKPGLVPGTYLVRIDCWKVPPSMGEPGKEVSYVDKSFKEPTIVVPAEGDDVEVPIDVPLAK